MSMPDYDTVECSECGAYNDIKMISLCGECQVEKKEEIINNFVNKLKKELDWTKIKDGTGCWSPGQITNKINRCVKSELNETEKKE